MPQQGYSSLIDNANGEAEMEQMPIAEAMKMNRHQRIALAVDAVMNDNMNCAEAAHYYRVLPRDVAKSVLECME